MVKKYSCLVLILGMFLGCRNGYAALWKQGSDCPEQVFPCPVFMFPEKDQEALKTGIPVDSFEDLARLMEDYLS